MLQQEAGLRAGLLLCDDLRRKRLLCIVKREAWPGGNDPVGEGEEAGSVVPESDLKPAVSAHESEQGSLSLKAGTQILQCFDRVIRPACLWGINQGWDKALVGLGGEHRHCITIDKLRDRRVLLQGLDSYGGEQDFIEREVVGSGLCDGNVAAMGRIESAAEECYAFHRFLYRNPGASWKLHGTKRPFLDSMRPITLCEKEEQRKTHRTARSASVKNIGARPRNLRNALSILGCDWTLQEFFCRFNYSGASLAQTAQSMCKLCCHIDLLPENPI